MHQKKAFVTMPTRHRGHTFSSVLEVSAADVKVVPELLRHSTARVTLDTCMYTQALNFEIRVQGE